MFIYVALHSSRHIGLRGPFLANDSWDEPKVLIEQTGFTQRAFR